MPNWEQRVALVTGGTRGIGLSVAEALARVGAIVALTGRDREQAVNTANVIQEASGGNVLGFDMDVTIRSSVEATVRTLLEQHGRIDILINNAGITRDNLLMRMKQEEWDTVISTNINGLYNCSQAVLRPMIRQRYGRIISMSSVVGLTGNPGQSNYATSKAAILGFTKALAREVASRQVTVNAVAPGYIRTDMTNSLPDAAREKLIESIPMGRIGLPEDVARTVLFLASEEASYVTGQIIQVNGGLYM